MSRRVLCSFYFQPGWKPACFSPVNDGVYRCILYPCAFPEMQPWSVLQSSPVHFTNFFTWLGSWIHTSTYNHLLVGSPGPGPRRPEGRIRGPLTGISLYHLSLKEGCLLVSEPGHEYTFSPGVCEGVQWNNLICVCVCVCGTKDFLIRRLGKNKDCIEGW